MEWLHVSSVALLLDNTSFRSLMNTIVKVIQMNKIISMFKMLIYIFIFIYIFFKLHFLIICFYIFFYINFHIKDCSDHCLNCAEANVCSDCDEVNNYYKYVNSATSQTTCQLCDLS